MEWSSVRRDFILGKRKVLPDKTIASEDYTYSELATKYEIDTAKLAKKARDEKWSDFRQSYLARVNELNIGNDLGLFDTYEYISDVETLNACRKVTTVLDNWLEAKFGDLFDLEKDIDKDPDLSKAERRKVVKAVDVKDLSESIKLLEGVTRIQKRIYENAPKTQTYVRDLTLTPDERKAKLESIAALTESLD